MAKKAVTKSKALIPEVIEAPPSAELVKLQTDGTIIEQFVNGLRVFFATAQQYEMEAKHNLVQMESRRNILPTNGDEDFALVEEVRRINSHRKELLAHWEITAVISRVHKTLTGIRGRGDSADETAAQIGNGLHQRYKDAETLRARQEEERLRLEAEERQRQERQKQQDELERQALKAEAASPDLSPREQKFVDAITSNVTGWKGNPTRAAEVAQYKDAQAQGAKLMALPKILRAIEAVENAARLRQQAAAVKAAPVEIEHVAVKADVAKGDVETWSAEVTDVALFLESYRSGRYGLAFDVVEPAMPKLNDLARSMHENMDRIPGLRAKKKTSVR